MTDPAFVLDPDVPRNVRLARWLLFRLLGGISSGSLTVREGTRPSILATRLPRCALRCRFWPRTFTGGC